ncbi:helix-turn-helix transcriptional regulator [Anaerorhabdus furcosa]|uniref:AraC-type DNA-binding protein n=1 Tax=Anaerorhabdus furcosa TaxID=118967 RepID=A0A1T4P2S3_9FIRM|nr:AraC family transcriptional regulator [Anaerorhabdus furcosa]SJZ85722.1 AraC-type DNA-binding protein [Anaerorhabdus furcosa]
MYNKTTSAYFLKFGKITDSFRTNKDLKKKKFKVTNKVISTLYAYSQDVYVETVDGMAIVAIADKDNSYIPQLFVIHRNFKIYAGEYFSFITLTSSSTINLYTPTNTTRTTLDASSPIIYEPIQPKLMVSEICAYYYMVKSPGYKFYGESHRYFELTFVDSGELETNVEGTDYTLKNYDLLLYGPNQYHTQEITSNEPCSYLTIIFESNIQDYSSIINRVFHCPREYYQILDKFVKMTTSPLPYAKDLMISFIQELILHLLQYDLEEHITKPSTPIHQHFENELLEEILAYINQKIYEPLPVDDICDHFSISRSSLQNLFKDNLKVAPKQYINEAKLAKSKVLIKKSENTISEISSMLGFNSIHYFSRKFTHRYNITPSEYAKKIYDDQ